MNRPRVELLYVDGCPNWQATRDLIEQTSRELRLDLETELVEVGDPESARRLCFLGSPTVRVDGRDVEPGAADRTGYSLSCRIYRTDRGVSGHPDPRWLRDALRRGAPTAERHS